ncbi:MAG: MoaD/ThiS family protein [Thermoplasmata archaeon]
MTVSEIQVPAPLRPATLGAISVRATGGTVGLALRDFARRDGTVNAYLFTSEGRLRRSVAVFVNGVDVRNLDGEDTTVRDGDILSIVPALSGG